MTETFTTILQWLIPSGSLGAVVIWLTNKTIRNLRATKEVHDTYKKMYEDVYVTLMELQGDNKKLYRAVSRLERAVSKVSLCRYYPNCPVNMELMQNADVIKPKGKKRQRDNCGIRDAPAVEETEETPEESNDETGPNFSRERLQK